MTGKASLKTKKKNVQVLREGGLHFPPFRVFSFSRLNHAAVMKIVFDAATVEAVTNEMPVSQDVS